MQEPNDENIEKIRGIFFDALKRSKPIDEVESSKLIKPLLYAVFHENGDQKKQQNESDIKIRIDAVFDAFENTSTVKKFIESHQLTRIERLFPIRAILMEHFIRHRNDISYESAFSLAKQKCDFAITDDLFKQFLQKMGFDIQRVGHSNFVTESHKQRLDRLKFIREIQKYRENEKNIIYFQERTIDFSRWNMHDGANCEIHNSFIVLLVANANGILNHRFASTIDSKEFTSYFSRFMALQPPNSVVVFDAKPYNELCKRSIPRMYETLPVKAKILRHLNIENDPGEAENYPTIQLMDKLWNRTETNVENDLKKILTDFKLEALRIPPNHPELNPLSNFDFYVTLSMGPVDVLDEHIFKNSIKHRLDSCEKDEWAQFMENVQNLEKKFFDFEKLCDNDVIEVDMNDENDSDVEIITDICDIIQIDED